MTLPAVDDGLEHVGCPAYPTGRTLCGLPTTGMNEVIGQPGVSGADSCVVCLDIETRQRYCPQCGEEMLSLVARLRRWRPFG